MASSGHEVQNAVAQMKTQVIASVFETFEGTTSVDGGIRGVDDIPPVGWVSQEKIFGEEDDSTPVPCDRGTTPEQGIRGTATVPANRGTVPHMGSQVLDPTLGA